MMKALVTLFIYLCFAVSTVQGAELSAQEVIKSTVNRVMIKLESESIGLESNPSKLYDLIHEFVVPRFNLVGMSKWVLGRKAWSKATETQREQFIDEFKNLLIRTYAKALSQASNFEIDYLPVEATAGSNLVVVRTRIIQSDDHQIPLDYRMHMDGAEWKVVDVVVDGISLISTYRGSFAAEIKKGGIDSLISKLSQRNTETYPTE